MTTPIDRESVERLAKMVAIACDILKDEFETLRAALDEAEEQITAMEEGLTAVHMSGYMDGKKAAEAENKRLREALSNIAVVGFSDDLAVSAAIANQAVTQARAALQENPDG